jgi:ABC-type multidrug transport system fused ATPase/permease subunit
VLKYISNSIDKTETSKIIARTEMSKSLISFLEDTVPIILSVIFATVGSLAAVYLMSPIAALIICFILIPVFFVIQYFYKKTKKMTFISNSNDELHVEKIQSGNLKIIFDYFTRRRRILIMNSTLNAKNYFAFDFLALFFILTTLIYFITTENSTTGDAIAFYGYINRFAYSLGGITYVINMVVQIRDISKRIE